MRNYIKIIMLTLMVSGFVLPLAHAGKPSTAVFNNADLTDLGGGWWLTIYGAVNANANGTTMYHEDLQWIEVANATGADIWLYSYALDDWAYGYISSVDYFWLLFNNYIFRDGNNNSYGNDVIVDNYGAPDAKAFYLTGSVSNCFWTISWEYNGEFIESDTFCLPPGP